MNSLHRAYYSCKKFIPRSTQLLARQMRAGYIERMSMGQWPCPVYSCHDVPGDVWKGGKKFCLVLTHDVDTEKGIAASEKLMNVELSLGFKSSFSIVPKKYNIPNLLLKNIAGNGFEVCVHGYNHDGRLFSNKKIFNDRKKEIERFLKKWNSVGFRAPAMHHNMEWISEMDIQYDMSTYEYDPFEPQGGGVGSIFPFVIKNSNTNKPIVELPYTLPQDHTLFVVLKRKSIVEWMKKVDFIAKNGGMALLITHPDYMKFNGSVYQDEYPVHFYIDFLNYVKEKYENLYWNPLPKDLAKFWLENETVYRKIGKNILSGKNLCSNCRKNLKKVIIS